MNRFKPATGSKRVGLCVTGILISVLLLIVPLLGAQEEEKKTRLTMQNIMASGLFQLRPAQFMWHPGGKSFLYIFRGALWRYDVETGEKEKLKPMREITTALMKDRETQREEVDSPDATAHSDQYVL